MKLQFLSSSAKQKACKKPCEQVRTVIHQSNCSSPIPLSAPQNNLRRMCQQGVAEEKDNPGIREATTPGAPDHLSVRRHLSADERWSSRESLFARNETRGRWWSDWMRTSFSTPGRLSR
ncbi:hypothetical protein CEXT_401501 [Caerostris extrusa]|uniref:Uncharacterized protein n=1 Tax=Caerostris extrusa TaxID=172846 RepID=A0AAV4NLQ6_CAEEX|nr:hypothetical protein CEXT_401501 [Caerostris extrusa]